jgi:molecular chaperone GrpE
VGETGERFDPERHEAVEVRESDEVEDRTVLEVVRSGFAMRDRVLRPAQVVVSRRPPGES